MIKIKQLFHPFNIFLILLPYIYSTHYDINNGPSLSNSDGVQFFYLEAPFPYNTPDDIKDAAGSNFDKYGIAHAGLGVWDTTTNAKFSIEFISNNYVGGLLPNVSDGYVHWRNLASIVITNPIDDSVWLNSRLITTTSGSAYSQLITYLQGNLEPYKYYQPVTGLYLNVSMLNTSQLVSNDDVDTVGTVLVKPTNSFAFVDVLISQLGSYGCDLGAFLQIYATSFGYIARDPVAPSVVSWTAGEPTNPDVYRWYTDLIACYQQTYDGAAASSQGASYFLAAVSSCYHEYAYIFLTTNSVYNITLGNSSADYDTPLLSQYVYNLPSSNTGDAETLQPIDYVIIAFAILAIFAGIYYFITKFFGKKERRRVSFEGDRVAIQTVANILGPEGDQDNEDRAYFHGKSAQSQASLSKSSKRYTASNLPKLISLATNTPSAREPDTIRSSASSLQKPLLDYESV